MSNICASDAVALTPFSFPELHDIWAVSEYDDEHIDILLKREKLRQIFHFKSPQIQYRSQLVNWMKEIATIKQLANHSIHLGVYILDLIMDNYDIVVNRLELVALVSLLLATKYEEQRATKMLLARDINVFVNNKFTMAQYYRSEVMILKHLKWNLNFPTIVHFIHVYIEHLYSPEEIIMLNKNSTFELYLRTKDVVHGLMDYVMEDIKLMQSKPSMVAAAIMACTRQLFNFSKIWPVQLMSISKYKLFELKGCTLRLKKASIFKKQND